MSVCGGLEMVVGVVHRSHRPFVETPIRFSAATVMPRPVVITATAIPPCLGRRKKSCPGNVRVLPWLYSVCSAFCFLVIVVLPYGVFDRTDRRGVTYTLAVGHFATRPDVHTMLRSQCHYRLITVSGTITQDHGEHISSALRKLPLASLRAQTATWLRDKPRRCAPHPIPMVRRVFPLGIDEAAGPHQGRPAPTRPVPSRTRTARCAMP